MAGWGIAKGAESRERIKSEYADMLNGLNSTGLISYEVYNELFDYGMQILDVMYLEGDRNGRVGHLIVREE